MIRTTRRIGVRSSLGRDPLRYPEILRAEVPTYWMVASLGSKVLLAAYLAVLFGSLCDVGLGFIQSVNERVDGWAEERKGRPVSRGVHAAVALACLFGERRPVAVRHRPADRARVWDAGVGLPAAVRGPVAHRGAASSRRGRASPLKILVIGGGLVGVQSAYFLRRSGHEVTVIDRGAAAGSETTYANALW